MLGGRSVGVVAALAVVPADGEGEPLDRLEGDAALEVDRLCARRAAVPLAVDSRELVAQHVVGRFAEEVQSPVGRGAEAEAVGHRLLEVAHAVEPLDEGYPRGVGRAETEDRGVVELGLDERLLDEHVVPLGAGIADVGLELRRPRGVEIMVHREVEALDVDADAGVATLHAGALVLVVLRAEVREHAAADGGLGERGGRRRRLRGRPVVGGEVVLEEEKVERGLVLGHDGLAVWPAADQRDPGPHFARALERLESLGRVEHVDSAVLGGFLVVEPGDLGGGGAGEQKGEKDGGSYAPDSGTTVLHLGLVGDRHLSSLGRSPSRVFYGGWVTFEGRPREGPVKAVKIRRRRHPEFRQH